MLFDDVFKKTTKIVAGSFRCENQGRNGLRVQVTEVDPLPSLTSGEKHISMKIGCIGNQAFRVDQQSAGVLADFFATLADELGEKV